MTEGVSLKNKHKFGAYSHLPPNNDIITNMRNTGGCIGIHIAHQIKETADIRRGFPNMFSMICPQL